jgi:uncharacterized linocin/CFP29 family protein
MNHLLRSIAPVSEAGWTLLDEEARERLTPALAARKLVDFSGPLGWDHSATNLGRTSPLDSAREGVGSLVRRVLPLVELRADFALSREELRDADRGAQDIDLTALDNAAHEIAVAENVAVFHGERLLCHGVAGPYGLALGREPYRRVVETAEHGGYPLFDHLQKILDGPIVWAPGVIGAVVLSLRGGDFLFESGQDLSIGYGSHDEQSVRLYLQESFSFRVATAEAAVELIPPAAS